MNDYCIQAGNYRRIWVRAKTEYIKKGGTGKIYHPTCFKRMK